MDETLIHCVDDIETQDPDVVLEIDFPDEETVYAGINIRPYIRKRVLISRPTRRSNLMCLLKDHLTTMPFKMIMI